MPCANATRCSLTAGPREYVFHRWFAHCYRKWLASQLGCRRESLYLPLRAREFDAARALHLAKQFVWAEILIDKFVELSFPKNRNEGARKVMLHIEYLERETGVSEALFSLHGRHVNNDGRIVGVHLERVYVLADTTIIYHEIK